jgi:dTDP-4-amino-4,6-dideoxygalactose transaminase
VKAGIVFDFYPVDHTLTVDFNEVCIEAGDAVLLISYFGVPTDPLIYASLKAKGACVIEDLSQAVYSTPSKLADFSVYSLRKFFAVPDGGVVISNGMEVNWPYVSPVGRVDLMGAVEALAGRSLFDAGLSDSKKWVSDFQQSEAALTAGLFRMSLFTRAQVAGSIDFEDDKTQRIKNFDYLLSELPEISLIHDRKGGVPLGFPVVTSNRDKVRQVLFEREIYPPIHWNIEGVVPAEFTESHKLSSQIMTIPCDGRYNLEDMQRVVVALRGACNYLNNDEVN